MDTPDLDARIRAAWDEVREYLRRRQDGKATAEEDPQPALASRFFEFYTRQTNSDLGRKALATAFAMWGNAGCAQAADQALAALDSDSADWTHVLHGVGNAYWRSGRQAEYSRLLHSLEDRLTHPRSICAVYGILGRQALMAGDTAEARKYYGRVMELQPDPFAVMEAAGALYEIDALQPGQDAPDFSAVTIDGETIRLTGFRGRIVLLDFWATGCGPCWPEFPHLRTLHTSLPESDFSLIGVSQDHDEDLLREILEQEHLLWPQIREPTQWRERVPIFGAVSKLYNVWGIPRTVLIDREGIILAKDLLGDVLVNAVRECLAA